MKVFISCPYGFGSSLSKELKSLGYKPFDTFEKGTYIQGNRKDVYTINIWSRIANKVFIVLAQHTIRSFDEYFAHIEKLPRKKYIGAKQGIHIKTYSKQCKLHSERTLQSLALKAILKVLLAGSTQEKRPMNPYNKTGIEIFGENDNFSIMLNTSGTALHERGYRTKTGKAPIKENVAAALIIGSARKFTQPFVDPFCGSGTFPIEAAMIARNIAPGLQRNFSFETMPCFDDALFNEIKNIAKTKQYNKQYTIIASDISQRITSIAKHNAQKAGVADTITFLFHDFTTKEKRTDSTPHIITNPPYGKRIGEDKKKVREIFAALVQQGEQGKYTGGFLSLDNVRKHNRDSRKIKVVYNGAEKCEFWKVK